MKVVLDTSVLVAAARSSAGASYAIISALPHDRFQICLSVTLYAEWCSVMTRPEHLPPGQTAEGALGFLRYLASIAHLQDIYYLWRPRLRDPNDDMLLELAVAAQAAYVVTHNVKDFAACEQFGIRAMTPGEFIQLLRNQK